jgi:hypothetical protein
MLYLIPATNQIAWNDCVIGRLPFLGVSCSSLCRQVTKFTSYPRYSVTRQRRRFRIIRILQLTRPLTYLHLRLPATRVYSAPDRIRMTHLQNHSRGEHDCDSKEHDDVIFTGIQPTGTPHVSLEVLDRIS